MVVLAKGARAPPAHVIATDSNVVVHHLHVTYEPKGQKRAVSKFSTQTTLAHTYTNFYAMFCSYLYKVYFLLHIIERAHTKAYEKEAYYF